MSIYPRTNYEMTQADLDIILAACVPTRVMMIGGSTGSSPQENANRAWAALGEKMGFDHMTVRPEPGMGHRFFTAIPSETEEQKAVRVASEAEAKRLHEIEVLESEIKDRKDRLDVLYRAPLRVAP